MSPGSVGFLFHPAVDRGLASIEAARRRLYQQGLETWEADRPKVDGELRARLRDTIVLVTFGGDGTFLHGGRLALAADIPIIGVNLGRLGFLTEVELSGLVDGLDRFWAGDYRLEPRVALQIRQLRGDRRIRSGIAINEAAVHKLQAGRMIRIGIGLDGQEVGTIDADGLLVSTATGSTAYSLAVGGPILVPTLRDLVVAPMNPFALSVRPLVVGAGETISVKLEREDAVLALDGHPLGRARRGDNLIIEACPQDLKVVRFEEPSRFFFRLRHKIGWGSPLVPTP